MNPPTIINLWPDGSKQNPADPTQRPRLEVYLPEGASQALRAAVIVLPGGGYANRAPHEGEPFARLFAAHGFVSFVCHYRVAPNRFPAPMADAARAVRLTRHLAGELGIDPQRIALDGLFRRRASGLHHRHATRSLSASRKMIWRIATRRAQIG